MRILLISLLLIGTSTIVHAQDTSEFCGLPEPAELNTAAQPHCDIYQRQFAYREEALKLRELMEERQENYARPRREAIERYEKDLEELNKQRSSEDF